MAKSVASFLPITIKIHCHQATILLYLPQDITEKSRTLSGSGH
ncbi:hypothetical protein HBZS_103800 [Helicobacter bizzozeronii CCUG 35545]|nr:hypothetical protein HBZS_103800 [Helicobacter bizzozeronii CCUG 35545]